ncbi:MAG: hypothetical protein JWN66_2482 [Sphingomonas bacterium]|uniref:hypothetical protein n=1 Tax=Sphingomonas bacterium TaxID=1895847 RepID=UPI0026300528|nr:hypothetical protein [Sphingomonas bacterium]MDB5705366.1 hypothetical protein [Sphingomonas bacterium]
MILGEGEAMFGIPFRLDTSLSRSEVLDRLRRTGASRTSFTALYLVAGPLFIAIPYGRGEPYCFAWISFNGRKAEIRGRALTGATFIRLISIGLLALSAVPTWHYLADGPRDVPLKTLIAAIMLVVYGLGTFVFIHISRWLRGGAEKQIALLQKTLSARTLGKGGR